MSEQRQNTENDASLALAEEAFRHSWDMSDERLIDGTWVAGLCCECGAFVPYGQEVAHVAAALAPLVAAMKAELARVREARSRIDFIRTPLDNLDGMPPSLAFHAGIKAAADLLDEALAGPSPTDEGGEPGASRSCPPSLA